MSHINKKSSFLVFHQYQFDLNYRCTIIFLHSFNISVELTSEKNTPTKIPSGQNFYYT